MAAHAVRGWAPRQTWVFVIGTLRWKHDELFAPFPQENRRDAQLVDFFRAAGVPAQQIVYLQDEHATFKAIGPELGRLLSRAGANDLLVWYYCGHGYKLDDGGALFASYDAGDEGVVGLPVVAVPDVIDELFGGARALLLADCCYSGCLADAVRHRAGRVSYACITSSSASELSTGNWTFTEGLLAGLRGEAFVDGDNSAVITLRELAEQIQGDMAFAEEQQASFVVTGDFDPELVLAAAQRKPHPTVGERVEVYSGGDWYRARIVDAADEQFKVHYYGWEASDAEWVTDEQIQPDEPEYYPVGSAVEVRWKGAWYPATVLDVHDRVHHIQYDGYDAIWNEWVSLQRIRQPEG